MRPLVNHLFGFQIEDQPVDNEVQLLGSTTGQQEKPLTSIEIALTKAKGLENPRGGGVEGAARNIKGIEPAKGLVTELPWAEEFLGRIRTAEDLLRAIGVATSPQEASTSPMAAAKKGAQKLLADAPKTLADWLLWKTRSGHPGVFREVADKLGLKFSYPQLDAIREAHLSLRKFMDMPMDEFIETPTAKNILKNAKEAEAMLPPLPTLKAKPAPAPMMSQEEKIANARLQARVTNIVDRRDMNTLHEWLDWRGKSGDPEVFERMASKLGMKFSWEDLNNLAKARMHGQKVGRVADKYMKSHPDQFFDSPEGQKFRVESARRARGEVVGASPEDEALIPTFPGRPPVVRTRGYAGTRDGNDAAWIQFQAKVSPEKVTYVSLHDQEHMAQARDWRQRMFQSHPDRGGDAATLRQLITDRYKWYQKELGWYKQIGLEPPAAKR